VYGYLMCVMCMCVCMGERRVHVRVCVCVWICDSLGCIFIVFIVLCQEHRKGPPLVQQLPLELPPVSNATECACGV